MCLGAHGSKCRTWINIKNFPSEKAVIDWVRQRDALSTSADHMAAFPGIKGVQPTGPAEGRPSQAV